MKSLLFILTIIIIAGSQTACNKKVRCDCRVKVKDTSEWEPKDVPYLDPYGYHPWEKKLYCAEQQFLLKDGGIFADAECKVLK